MKKGITMVTNTLTEGAYPLVGKEIPDLIPNVRVGFRVHQDVTLAYVWIHQKLRIGVAVCSIKDRYNQVRGEKIALRLAFAQHDMTYPLRAVLWHQYLYSRGIEQKDALAVMQVFVFQARADTHQIYRQ
jgi:hypothetical protein